MTMPWLPMPTLVPKTERKAGEVRPSLEHEKAFLLHVEPEPAIFDRHGDAEETKLLHFLDDLGGNGIVLGHLVLNRPQPLVDEAADGGDQLFACFGIEGHVRSALIFCGFAGAEFSR